MSMKRLAAIVVLVAGIALVAGATGAEIRAESGTDAKSGVRSAELRLTEVESNQQASDLVGQKSSAAVSDEQGTQDSTAYHSERGCPISDNTSIDEPNTDDDDVRSTNGADDVTPTIDISGTTPKVPDPEPKIPPPRD